MTCFFLKGYSLTVEPRSSKPLVWVRFLLSLIIITHLRKPLLSKYSFISTSSLRSHRKRINNSLYQTKPTIRTSRLKSGKLTKRISFTKTYPSAAKLRRHPYLTSTNGSTRGTFFRFVKIPSAHLIPTIPYPKFLVSQLKTSSNDLVDLRSHILLLRNKFSLYELYKELILLRLERALPNFKLTINYLGLRSRPTSERSTLRPINFEMSDYLASPRWSQLFGSYLSILFARSVNYSRTFIFINGIGAAAQSHISYLAASRIVQKFKQELSFRSTVKWLNIRRRRDFKRYYTFYSHYEDTFRDKRSYRRVMLPKFKDSKRGSLWDLSTKSRNTKFIAAPTTKNFIGTNELGRTSHRHVSSLELSRSITSATTGIKRQGAKLTKPKTLNLAVTPRRLVRLKVKRLRRIRRFLRRFFKRFRGLYGYLRRHAKRHKRKLRRFTYRFTKSRRRRMKKPSLRWSRNFFRRRYFKVVRRRVRRLLRRRPKLSFILKKRPKHRRLPSEILTLRKILRHVRRVNILLNRPSFNHIKLKLNLLSSYTNSINSRYSSSSTSNHLLPSNYARVNTATSTSVSSVFLFNNELNLTELSPFKYLLTRQSSFKQPNYYSFKNLIMQVQQQVSSYSRSLTVCRLDKSNLWFISQTGYSIRRKFLRLIASSSFSADLSFWYYKTLIQFVENCSGRRTNLYFGPFIENSLTFEDRARCTLWNNRVTGFQRIMGHRIFVYEALSIVAISIRIKDPTFLANWIRGMLRRLSFWRYRLIFRYIKFLLRYIFQPNFHLFDFRGVKLSLKGKISVAGNARTRTLFMRFGDTSHSKMDNKVAYDLSLVNTFTGVLGFKLLFYY